jgi:glutamate---cysteine ligase / carboxylate-amine ligase
VDTLFDSARLNSVFAFPLSGRAPFVLSWDEFASGYFTKMESTGVVKSMKDFYWDIRPKPEYGTIELRVCDTPLTVERAAGLACYLQALCRHLLERNEPPPEEDDYLVYTYNRFQACRFGLDGMMVNPKTREQISIREDMLATLRQLEPHAEALRSQAALDEIERTVARRQPRHLPAQRCFAESGSVQAVVRASVDALRSGPAVAVRRDDAAGLWHRTDLAGFSGHFSLVRQLPTAEWRGADLTI